MSVKVENLEKNMAKITIEVAAEELVKAMEAAYQKQKNSISLPGFRKGKVPMNMVEKMYGPQVFYEEAANILMQQEYPKAMIESKLDIVSRPTIDIVQLEKGKPFIFTAEVAVRPEVTLGEYKGVQVTKIDTAVTAAEVNAEVDKEREANARTINVEDRGVKKGDTVIIDYAGSIDGVAFEGGTAQNQPLEIGSHTFIDTFEDQLVGKKIGDDVDVHVNFPEDYHAAELAGKPALFQVKIHEIKVKELPKADDEFAQEVSEFDTLKEYKADLKKKLVEGKKNAAKRAQEDEALQAIVAASSMDIPEAMIEFQCEDMINGMAQQMAQQGLSLDQYFQFTGSNMQAFKEQVRPEAIKRIQTSLVLEQIAKDAKIKVSDKAVEEELEKMAKMYNMELDQLKGLMSDDEKEAMKKDLAIQGAVDLVMKHVVEVEKEEEAETTEEKKAPAKKKTTTTKKETAEKKETTAKKTTTKKTTKKVEE